jgi:ubiquinone/menaquinone biosynthesis C-methylase UbiE
MASSVPVDYTYDRTKKYASHFSADAFMSIDEVRITDVKDDERLERQKKAAQVASDYYDMVSPMYEKGWGQRFHYCPMTPGLSIEDSMTQYELMFAGLVGLKKGMRVLDVGCGIGGPARTFASSIGCEIVGITNNAWHVERGQALTQASGLEKLVTHVQGDFLTLPFDDASFDAAYAFDAMCYAPDQAAVYKEIYRVLKAGGTFGFSDWAMTDKFNEHDMNHRRIRNWIEFGNGITKMPLVEDMREGLKLAGRCFADSLSRD